jgi:hypothetical protein
MSVGAFDGEVGLGLQIRKMRGISRAKKSA